MEKRTTSGKQRSQTVVLPELGRQCGSLTSGTGTRLRDACTRERAAGAWRNVISGVPAESALTKLLSGEFYNRDREMLARIDKELMRHAGWNV